MTHKQRSRETANIYSSPLLGHLSGVATPGSEFP